MSSVDVSVSAAAAVRVDEIREIKQVSIESKGIID